MDFSAAHHHGFARVAARFAGAVVVGLVAVGCTPQDGAPNPATTPTPVATATDAPVPADGVVLGPESNPVAVAQRFYDGILNGEDDIICALITPEYSDALIRSQTTATCPEASAKAFAEIRTRHQATPLQFKARDARINPDGQSALVRVSGGMAPQKDRGQPTLNDVTLPVVRSGVTWLVNPPTQTAAPTTG